jgi:acetate---CoA ligase (ADP-forming)
VLNTAPTTLDPLLAPRSVAIIGASNDPTRISGRSVRYLRESGYSGGLYPVNPTRTTVQGLPAFPSLGDLPEVPEVVIVAVTADRAVEALAEAAAAGVKGAVVFSSGFAELGEHGVWLQCRVSELAATSGMRVVGPNCLGVFNARERFFGTFASALDRELPIDGPVAVASQSGAYGAHLYSLARRRRVAVGYMITTGNEADVDVAEAIGWLAARDDVEVILGYAEGIRDGERFLEAVRVAHEHQTPVIFLKTGRSEVGVRAASSHTAALAVSDDVFETVCEEYGVLRVTTTEEQLEAAYGCLRGLRPPGRRLGIVTLSGGMGVQICDAADRHGLEVPPLPNDVQTTLGGRFPYASFANPIDVTAQALQDWDLFDASLDVALSSDRYDAVIASLHTVPLAPLFAVRLQQAFEAAMARYPRRLVVVSCLAEPETVRAYEDAGLLVFEDSDRAVATIAMLARANEALASAIPDRRNDPGSVIELTTGSEVESKRLLATAGVPVLQERLVTSSDDAVAAADELGYPVALKVVSPDVLHKTDVGGVVLGVADSAGARVAYADIHERVRAATADARVSGVLVTPMAPPGVDVIIGSHRDPLFGPVVMFGLGGVFVEILRDVALALAPLDQEAALKMIRSIRGYPLLAGARGAERADIDALARAIVALSEFAAANSDTVQSVDVNPLRVFGSGAAALDAVIVPVLKTS